MKLLKLTLAIALGAFLLAAMSAEASSRTLYSNPDPGVTDNGDFDGASTWILTDDNSTSYVAPPDSTDTAYVREGDTIDVDANSGNLVLHLHVRDISSGTPGILNMEANGLLQVYGSVTVETAEAVDGIFQFNAASASPPILKAYDGTVTLDGPYTVATSQGGVFARHNISTFQLLSGGLITSDSGPITISAPMDNDGVIRATGTSTSYAITITVAPDAGSTGRFESADNDNARMVFGASAGVTWTTSLTGPYLDIRQGGMTFSDTVGDEAGLRILDGFLIVANGEAFTANEVFVAPG